MASLVVAGDVSGSVTLSAPSAAGSTVLTLPTSSGTLVVTGGAQTIEFADGSASAPSITNSGDTNTGMFFPAADTIAFTEGGVESMRIDSSGNLGLGVTPSAWSGFRALQVGGTTSLWSSTSGNSSSFYTNNGFYNGSNRIYLTNGEASEYIMGQGQHIWYTAASGTAGNTITFSERMRIDSSGNVGIGTSSPVTKLELAGTTSSTALKITVTTATTYSQYTNNGGDFYVGRERSDGGGFGAPAYSSVLYSTGAYPMSFWTNTTERMRIASAGLVSTTGSISSGGYVIGAGYYRSSGMVNETVTVTTEATVYSMNKDSGSGGSSSTSTYNITGLSNTDGSWAIIYIRNSNTAAGINTVQIVQIHGTKVWEGNVQNTTKTASFLVFRQNGSWQTTAWATGGVMNNVW